MRKSYGFRTFRCLELALYHSLGKVARAGIDPRFFLTNHKSCAAKERTSSFRKKRFFFA
jgi:hypothetical protein